MLNHKANTEIEELFSRWRHGYGVTQHKSTVIDSARSYVSSLSIKQAIRVMNLLISADHLCSAGQWLTSQMTYCERVYLDGRPLQASDCKRNAQGHLGGALNMVPAYTGYLLANSLSGKTRAWLMGQGHCVAAVEAINTLYRNQYQAHAARYSVTDAGLSQLCNDFYGYEIDDNGKPSAPLGSHVNPHTAGGINEGGYLGFAALQYSHMPLPGQELVTFLSDGAFEEQRGGDWAPRWWRKEDTGMVMPIMIANGRRIDQRSSIEQKGGVDWLRSHLKLNGFDPFVIDGSDPAAFAFAILSMNQKFNEHLVSLGRGTQRYPIKLPYAIADVEKGHGLPNAGTNAAHSLPLGNSLRNDEAALDRFNKAIATCYVAPRVLAKAVGCLRSHESDNRPLEHSHFMRDITQLELNFPDHGKAKSNDEISPMSAVDDWFVGLVKSNPSIRFRMGNPDEISSNRFKNTLAHLKHRSANPEPGTHEAIAGGVITALNEEAVVCAALGNKQGVSLVVSYEAFAIKMLGAIRQELLFSRHQREFGYHVDWTSIPILVTSHTWENGKNEQSHQDPTFSECSMKEMSDTSRVYFPFDSNTATATLEAVYRSTGNISVIVLPKNKMKVRCGTSEAQQCIKAGYHIFRKATNSQLQLIAIGAYQLEACIEASKWLVRADIETTVIAITEPARFRVPRDPIEKSYCYDEQKIKNMIPPSALRIIVSHTRSDIITQVLRALDTGRNRTKFLGYNNCGGTLDVFGMQFANQQTWAHIAKTACQLISSHGGEPQKCFDIRLDVNSIRSAHSNPK